MLACAHVVFAASADEAQCGSHDAVRADPTTEDCDPIDCRAYPGRHAVIKVTEVRLWSCIGSGCRRYPVQAVAMMAIISPSVTVTHVSAVMIQPICPDFTVF